MGKYLKVYRRMLKNSFMRDMEYRADFFIVLAHLIVYVFFNVAFYRVIFNNVNSIEGWSFSQMIVLVGTFMIIDSLFMTFMLANFGDFNSLIRLGELDHYLVKPVDVQFMATLKIAMLKELSSFVIGIFVVSYGLSAMHFYPTFWGLLIYAFLIGVSMIIIYSFGLILASLIFIFEKIEEVHEVIISFVQFAKIPDVYRGPIKIVFMLFAPVVFASFVPVGILFGKVPILFLVYYLAITVIFFTLSRLIWKLLLKGYKSPGG